MGVLITPPDEKGPRFKRWLRVGYDEQGREESITDYTGSEVKVGYDNTGESSIINSKLGGVQIERDQKGKVQKIKTSWGYLQVNTYDPQSGEIKRYEINQGNDKAIVDFDKELPRKVRQFDGGEINISYYEQDSHKDQIKDVQTPNGLILNYEYDSENRITAVNCGSVYRVEYKYDLKGRLVDFVQIPKKK
jgi:hypothetical protein